MLRRDVKLPPNAPFMISIATLFAALVDGATSPARISDCGAPGLSIRYTRGLSGTPTWAIASFGIADDGAFQSPKIALRRAVIASRVVSPATRIRTLSGRMKSRIQLRKSCASSDSIEAAVPEPVNGIAYG